MYAHICFFADLLNSWFTTYVSGLCACTHVSALAAHKNPSQEWAEVGSNEEVDVFLRPLSRIGWKVQCAWHDVRVARQHFDDDRAVKDHCRPESSMCQGIQVQMSNHQVAMHICVCISQVLLIARPLQVRLWEWYGLQSVASDHLRGRMALRAVAAESMYSCSCRPQQFLALKQLL